MESTMTERRKKVTKEIADHRRREVRRALGNAEHCYDIVTRFAAEWQISRRQVEAYITQVRAAASAELSQRGETERQAQARELEDFLLDTMAKARQRKDYRTSVAAARELGKIRGAYAPERIEHTGAGGVPLLPPQQTIFDLSRLSDDEAKKATEVLRALVRAAPVPLTDGSAGSGEPKPDDGDDDPEG
jgi:hypothetical protein